MQTVSNLTQGMQLASSMAEAEFAPNSFPYQVVEFNQRVLKIEPRRIGALPPAEYDITVKSLKEEVEEFQEAHVKGDIIGGIDALVDLMYFAVGALYKKGLTAESIVDCMTAVHEANMEKKLGVNARRGDGSAADAIKPEGWVAPEERIALILDHQMSKS